MKLAVVSHLQGLEAVDRVGLSTHMALAQHLLADALYSDYYRTKHKLGHFIIVDNGAYEGNTPPFAQVVGAANSIGADEIVMPDIIGDCDASWPMTTNSLYCSFVAPYRRLVVPHGHNWDEWLDCLTQIDNRIDYATIGIPKYLEAWPGGREHALQLLLTRGAMGSHNIHLLGSYAHPILDVSPKNFPTLYIHVRSIDTSAPIAWAQSNLELTLVGIGKQIIRWGRDVPLKLAEKNIAQLNDWCYQEGAYKRPLAAYNQGRLL